MTPQWTTPPPPGGPGKDIRGGKVAAGIGFAMLGHLVATLLAVGVVFAYNDSPEAFNGVILGFFAEVVVFILCMVFGVIQLTRGDKGLGLGLLIGWAVGVIVLPVIGFGVCVWVLSGQGGT